MSVRAILQLARNEFGGRDTPLRLACSEVVDFGDGFQNTVDDLIETLEFHRIAVFILGAMTNRKHSHLWIILSVAAQEAPSVVPLKRGDAGKRVRAAL